ncbi:MAG: carboxymuconolactone decarboxylase family protein [Coxiellaceae bacterium]|nr:carboxymuconolactone decarboxylase family protein [Coxiellaceae bacterium]
MTIQELRNNLPDYAKDIRLNLSSVLTAGGAPGLKQEQVLGVALASAYATKEVAVIEALTAEVDDVLTQAHVNAAKAAAVIMAMNNIYYRFAHLTSDTDLQKMPANLRMSVVANPGIEQEDFELYSLAVSALNGCGKCMDAHSATLIKSGVSREGVQSAVRIASVINAAAQGFALGV